MKKYVVNSFSFNMVNAKSGSLQFEEIELEKAKNWLNENNPQSFVGHEDTAHVLSNLTNYEIPFNRGNISLNSGDTLLVGQYVGPRLPEGATQLPEGSRIKWLLITIG